MQAKENALVVLQIYIISFPSLILSLFNRSFSFTRVLCAASSQSLSSFYGILNNQRKQMSAPQSPDLLSSSLSLNSNGWFRQQPYFAAFSNSALLQSIMHHQPEPNNIKQCFK
jgi:hypothetical protein